MLNFQCREVCEKPSSQPSRSDAWLGANSSENTGCLLT